jgi:VanZ family protein
MNFSPFRFTSCASDDMPDTAKSKLRNLLICWLPLIIYGLIIYIQSDHPSPEEIPSWTFLDKILHFGAYGLMGILFFRAYETLPLRNNKSVLILISIGSATLYGISDEIHQYFVPFREAEIMDVIANTMGSACGVYFYHLWKTQKKPA